MPEYLPWTMITSRYSKGNEINVYTNYNGVWNSWYRDGTKLFECYMENGKRNGIALAWNENGSLMFKSGFKNGEFHGKYESWYDKGTRSEKGFWKNGKLEGLHESWYENGTKLNIDRYLNGKSHGLQERWHPNGKKYFEYNYINDQQISGIFWNEDGSLKSKEYCDSKGKLKKRELYLKNKIHQFETEVEVGRNFIISTHSSETGELIKKVYKVDGVEFIKRELFKNNTLVKTETVE